MTQPSGRQEGGPEGAISAVLRVGVAASLVLVACGSALSFLQGSYAPGPGEVARLIGATGSFPRTASWFFGGLAHLDGQAIIVAGLLVLIATPVLRVGVSLVAFFRERDRAFIAITAVVLALLLVSFVLGRSG
jgi:uncharacterized membrane protein